MSMSCCGHESQWWAAPRRQRRCWSSAGRNPTTFVLFARGGNARQGSRPWPGTHAKFPRFSPDRQQPLVGLVKKPECRPESRPMGHVNVEGIRQTREGMTKMSRPSLPRQVSLFVGADAGKSEWLANWAMTLCATIQIRECPPLSSWTMFFFFFPPFPSLPSSCSYFSCVISTTPVTTQTSLGRSTRTERDRRKPPGNASAAGASSRWNGALGQSWKSSTLVGLQFQGSRTSRKSTGYSYIACHWLGLVRNIRGPERRQTFCRQIASRALIGWTTPILFPDVLSVPGTSHLLHEIVTGQPRNYRHSSRRRPRSSSTTLAR